MRLARPLRAVACQMNAKFKVSLLANVSASRRLLILICMQLGRACSAGTALLKTYLHTCKAIVVTFRNTLYGVLNSAGSGLVCVFASCVFTRPIDSEVNGVQLNFESSPGASQARSPCSEPNVTVSSCHESGSAIMPGLPTQCNVANHNGDEFSNLDQFGFQPISRLFRKDTANGEERHHKCAAEEDIEHQVGDGRSCCICLDAGRDAVLLPCGHVACCYACAKTLAKPKSAKSRNGEVSHNVCPICRKRIKSVARLYFP